MSSVSIEQLKRKLSDEKLELSSKVINLLYDLFFDNDDIVVLCSGVKISKTDDFILDHVEGDKGFCILGQLKIEDSDNLKIHGCTYSEINPGVFKIDIGIPENNVNETSEVYEDTNTSDVYSAFKKTRFSW